MVQYSDLNRARRFDNSFSTHEPIRRSSVTFAATNSTQARIIAGNSDEFAIATATDITVSQIRDASAAESASPYAIPIK